MSARPIAPSLRGGAPLTGVLLKMPCAAQVEAAGAAGFDLVVLDTEHGPRGGFELEHHLRAADGAGLPALVRVPNQDPVWIQDALDSGAAGVIVPRVLDAAQARALVTAARYPPGGRRGLALTTRAGHHGAVRLGDHLARAEELALVIQVEDAEALAVLDELVAIDGVDGVLIGANDLSMSLGHPGKVDHPKVAAAVDAIIAAARRQAKAVMCIGSTPGEAQRLRARGAGTVLFTGAQLVLGAFSSAAAGARPIDDAPGGREPLLLVPGTGCDHDLWTEVAAAVTPVADPLTVRIDLDDSVAEMAATVLAAAPSRFALAGHSQGAIVCLEIMRQAPERVMRLAILNASARPGSDHGRAAWAELRDRLEASGDRSPVIREMVALNLGGRRDEALTERMVAMVERIGRHGLLRQINAQFGRPDSRPSLGAIRCPTLVVAGADDGVCPEELTTEVAQSIPGARLAVIEGCGHMSPIEQPDRVSALLLEWLAARR